MVMTEKEKEFGEIKSPVRKKRRKVTISERSDNDSEKETSPKERRNLDRREQWDVDEASTSSPEKRSRGSMSKISDNDNDKETSSIRARGSTDQTEKSEGDDNSISSRRKRNVRTKSLRHAANALKDKSISTACVIKDQTIETYHHSYLCCLPRWIGSFPRNWPRVTSFVFGIVVPLWILIGLAFGFGYLLAGYENGHEIEANDSILAARARIHIAEAQEVLLLHLPVVCMDKYLEDANRTKFDEAFTTAILSGGEFTPSEAAEGIYAEMQGFLETCMTQSFSETFNETRLVRDEYQTAFSSLTFNWIRCWNDTLLDNKENNVIFHPSREIIAASHPDAQEDSYQNEWTRMQEDLFDKYLPANPTDEERDQALERSIVEATGGGSCRSNLGGTAWFFFTIMTTVGYGNQAPVTYEGRASIYSAGFVSLIAFGIVLSTAGYVLSALVDDFCSRFWLSHLMKKPWIGMIFWGAVWLAWALILATDMYWWWAARTPEVEVVPSDAVWFAYISTSTIGLGDFYPQPELIFASDALKFSLNFLVGFVFLSTFFSKIVDVIRSVLPDHENSLEARLKATSFCLGWPKTRGSRDKDEEEEGEEEIDLRSAESVEKQAQVERIQGLQNYLNSEESMDYSTSSFSIVEDSFHTAHEEEENSSWDIAVLLDQEEMILRQLLARIKAKKRQEVRLESFRE